jgi:pimeloyl-ACP methyl ester carboxylesterase
MSVSGRAVCVHADQVRFLQTGRGTDTGTIGGQNDTPPVEAEIVVLVHGIAGRAQTWGRVLAELDRREVPYRVIAPDLISEGHTDHSLGGYANMIRDLLAALGHRRATIVGHSLGGGIALQFAYQYPQSCARLVLVDSGGLGRQLHPILRAASLPGAEWVLPVLTHTRVVAAAARVYGAVRGLVPAVRPSVQEVAGAFASLSDGVRQRAFVATARSVIDMAGQRISGLDKLHLAHEIPTMIVWGGRDPIIPLEHAHHAAEALPNARLEIFELAGHFPHCDEPVRFTDLLMNFLGTTQPARLKAAE